ncbi:MAG: FtsK/SpoIIIE domain-containing protein [Chloroflexota bacterium]
MPEFRHRIDSEGWCTPTFGDVFAEEETIEFDTAMVDDIEREIILLFTGAAVHFDITSIQRMPSYTTFAMSFPDGISLEALQRYIYSLENEKGWLIGINREDDTTCELLVRTNRHEPLNWKHIISRVSFRKARARTSFIAGVGLGQNMLIRDWTSTKHLLILGSGGPKLSILRNILLTMSMMFTPMEMRFALVGSERDEYRELRTLPHALGYHQRNATHTHAIALIRGMVWEMNRRLAHYESYNAQDFNDYNHQLATENKVAEPRLILVLNSMSNAEWAKTHTQWTELLSQLLQDGHRAGIHVIVAMQGANIPAPFETITQHFSQRLITHSAASATNLAEDLQAFHPTLMRFVDSFYSDDHDIYPIELPAITAKDLRSVSNYWQRINESRWDTSLENVNGHQAESVEDIYRALMGDEALPAPPVPSRPNAQTLARVTEILAESTVSLNAEDAKRFTNLNISVETVQRAQALATYLGWLGKGPLMDVLGLTLEESEAMIAILQARQILERTTSPTPHLHFKRRK